MAEINHLTKIPSFFWNNSPRHVFSSLRGAVYRVARPQGIRDVFSNSKYSDDLLELFWKFIESKYPEDALSKEDFVGLIRRYQAGKAISPNNVYFADLWELFAPDYTRRLPDYYSRFEYHSTITMLDYANRPDLISESYFRPYQIAQARLGRISVLELGGGIPHGLIYNVLYGADESFNKLTPVDVPGVFSDFVEWFCTQKGLPFSHVIATAGKTATLPCNDKHEFVFAKDVFEHLEDPTAVIREVLRVVSDGAILALDVVDRGVRKYQHITTDLSPVRNLLAEEGYREFAASGRITMFARAKV